MSHRPPEPGLEPEGEPVPIVHHQHVLVLPRPRLRSCRRPLHASPTSGRYRLPRPVLDRLLGEAAPLRNGEAVVLLATFVARFQTGPRCLGRSFPLDRRVLAAHPALGLSEARVRGALAALVALGFLEAEEAAPGRRYQRTVEGLHRRAVLYRVAPSRFGSGSGSEEAWRGDPRGGEEARIVSASRSPLGRA